MTNACLVGCTQLVPGAYRLGSENRRYGFRLDARTRRAFNRQIIQLLKESQNPDTETQRSEEQVSKDSEVVFVCMVYCCID